MKGTKNALLCGSVANGVTVIRNAYVSPEVCDLIGMRRLMGAKIDTFGNSQIRIEGTRSLRGVSYRVMPDRMEAITWLVYAVLVGGKVILEEVPFEALKVPLVHVQEACVDLFRNSRDVYVTPECLRTRWVQPSELACGTHPGVISDMQPFFVLMGLTADGASRIVDYRYPTRTGYLEQLSKFCPDAICWSPGSIVTHGLAILTGTEVASTDLRGGMALVLAGLPADGVTRVENVDLALWRYNKLTDKLANLGIKFELCYEFSATSICNLL